MHDRETSSFMTECEHFSTQQLATYIQQGHESRTALTQACIALRELIHRAQRVFTVDAYIVVRPVRGSAGRTITVREYFRDGMEKPHGLLLSRLLEETFDELFESFQAQNISFLDNHHTLMSMHHIVFEHPLRESSELSDYQEDIYHALFHDFYEREDSILVFEEEFDVQDILTFLNNGEHIQYSDVLHATDVGIRLDLGEINEDYGDQWYMVSIFLAQQGMLHTYYEAVLHYLEETEQTARAENIEEVTVYSIMIDCLIVSSFVDAIRHVEQEYADTPFEWSKHMVIQYMPSVEEFLQLVKTVEKLFLVEKAV